jgi:hypothetical protein
LADCNGWCDTGDNNDRICLISLGLSLRLWRSIAVNSTYQLVKTWGYMEQLGLL